MVKGLGRGSALQMPFHDFLPGGLTRPEYALHSSVMQSLQGNTAHKGGTVTTVHIRVSQSQQCDTVNCVVQLTLFTAVLQFTIVC